jgi:amino-acid N-acetyltransferase
MGSIRRARTSDVPRIYKLVEYYANLNQLLPRSLAGLYDNLRDFQVYVEGSEILGVCSLHVCWEDLAEIKSFCVEQQSQRRGIGRQLVTSCLEDCEPLGITRVFALTYQPDFFEGLGFRMIEKTQLPHKIWADCVQCVKFPECDEIALLLEISKEK